MKENESALRVQKGVEPPDSINLNFAQNYRRKRKLNQSEYVEGVLSGNRAVLSQAITLLESSLPEHEELAAGIIEQCIPHSGKSLRIGITGVPGVGKSSFIETFGIYLLRKNHRLAVLAIDPSSQRSGGSILGDKTRMETLSREEKAFIRPSPSGTSLGGVARKTRETILLCEAAGFDVIIVETVGVGQSETAVHSMVDFFLLLMLAGAGDELQGIKRGIMEMADLIAINKADGDNQNRANLARMEYANALHLFPPTGSGWTPRVETCSALEKKGIGNIWDAIQEYMNLTKENSFFEKKRRNQAKYWMYGTIQEELKEHFFRDLQIQEALPNVEREVLEGRISSFQAAKKLLQRYFSRESSFSEIE
ncbi:MAG: methylmalonyl Co-A mutase-associated GTPase MeaB [Leptospiraceae bacterium]|nr:methylmalonyl Co-A mutase-associated GTPase MeaB [Leptospiraceae bacterium]MCP5502374.1 methylmalonyl Co-A mutase-associated GTPase MeaB [Leptospiraceae bacterium]